MLRRLSLILYLSGLSLLAYNQTRNLDYYLNEGTQNSPLLNDYKNQISSAISDSLLVRAAKKPSVDARSQLLYSPYYNNFGYDEVITDGGNYTAVVAVTQNIFNKKEITNKYKSVDVQKQILSNTIRITATELNKIITQQYLSAYSSFNDLTFNKAFLDLFKQENEIVKQFVTNGVYKQTDYLALVVEAQSLEILIRQIENQYMKDLSLLNQICGISDTARYELVKPDLAVMGNPDISKSPGYIKYKIDSVRIETERSAIDIKYKPKVNWFADAGFLTSNPWNFYKHFGYSAGMGLNIPIYDGKQQAISKQKLDFEQNSRKNYENNYQKQYFTQIRQLKTELKALNDISDRTEIQLNTTRQLVAALKGQLEAGMIQLTEYINAVKNLKTINSYINLINVQKLQVINEMNFLLSQ
jgi:outer membrane protein TolC